MQLGLKKLRGCCGIDVSGTALKRSRLLQSCVSASQPKLTSSVRVPPDAELFSNSILSVLCPFAGPLRKCSLTVFLEKLLA